MPDANVHPGRLRQKITIQYRADGQDATGAPNGAWTELASVFAAIEPISGREWLASGVVNADITNKITIRYGSEVAAATPAHRVLFGTRIFNIVAIRNIDEANRWLELVVKEIVA